MYDQNQAYQKLEKSIIDFIAEGQAKLGYSKESIQLYYPLASLNHFFNSSVTADAMEKKLTGFCDFAAERLGSIRFSHAGDRFCFYLAPEAAEYVHENKEKDVFIFELVKLLQERNTTLESVITLFQEWDNSCVVEKVDTDEFDILIRFVNRDDPYYYCFKDEGCHVIYHRYLPEDYADFGF